MLALRYGIDCFLAIYSLEFGSSFFVTVRGALAMAIRKFVSVVHLCLIGAFVLGCSVVQGEDSWNTYPGREGAGHGKSVVLVSGDEEYRSEEALSQLGKILATRHGFDCVVLYAIDEETGEIAPNEQGNIPGLEALRSADLMVIATRFRNLPDGQMKEIDDYLRSGRPVIGMRTATHAFKVPQDSPYAHYSFNYKGDKKDWTQGFGRLVLGETWINHHGRHKFESTRGIIAPGAEEHAVLRGIKDGDIWGPTDVYGVRIPLPGDSQPLVLGQVLSGMEPDSDPVAAPPESLKTTIKKVDKNDPMMPVAWVKSYSIGGGPSGRVFTTTMGASIDMESEGVRRLLVNACCWAVGLEDKISGDLNVDIVGEFKPTMYGFRKGKTAGITPDNLR